MLLIGYMLVSILWSDIPFTSFKRWTRELVAVVMAFVVLTEEDPRQAVLCVIRRTVYILIPFSLLLIKYYSEYGVQYGRWSGGQTWIGVTMQKNGLGRLCLIAAFFLIWTLIRRWRRRDIPVGMFQTHADLFVLTITLWLLKGPEGAHSATAIAALAVGLTAFIGLLWTRNHLLNKGTNALTPIMALAIVYGINTLMVGGTNLESFTRILGREETLTGRTDVWAGLLPIAMQQPILGHGFGSFWTPTSRVMHNISEAHNGFLEIILELGFVGIFFFSIFLMSCCRKANREMTYDFDWGTLWFCYLLIAVLHNVTESSLQSFTSHLTAILLFLAVSNKARTSETPEIS